MLRPGAHLGQARRLRYSAVSQEGLLCAGVQWRARRPALGFRATKVCRHAHHHRLHQNIENVLHITEQLDGSTRGAQAGDVAQ
jgi:hypothetical protein